MQHFVRGEADRPGAGIQQDSSTGSTGIHPIIEHDRDPIPRRHCIPAGGGGVNAMLDSSPAVDSLLLGERVGLGVPALDDRAGERDSSP